MEAALSGLMRRLTLTNRSSPIGAACRGLLAPQVNQVITEQVRNYRCDNDEHTGCNYVNNRSFIYTIIYNMNVSTLY